MSILLVSENFPPKTGGSARWFWELYRRIDMPVAVVAGGDPGDRQPGSGSPRVHRAPLTLTGWGIARPSSLAGYLRALRRIWPLLSAEGSRFVHCGRVLPEGVLALAIRLARGTPYLCYVHGEDVASALQSRELSFLVARVLARASAVVANSRNTARMLREDWRMRPERLHILNPGVDTDRYRPSVPDAGERNRLGWGDRTVVATVGRLQRRKGHDHMLRALAKIREAVPGVLYAIVGDGEERAALERLARELSVEGAVQFMGEVDDEVLLRVYQQCQLFALPNREIDGDIEGFGMVLLEAQACGRAVLAGASGGTAEAMSPGETGLLVDASDPEAIAATVVELLHDPARLTKMGEAGRRFVVEHFDWTALAERARTLFAQLQREASSSS